MKLFLVIFLILCYLTNGFITFEWFEYRSNKHNVKTPWWVKLLVLVLWPIVSVLTLVALCLYPIYKFGHWIYAKIVGKKTEPENQE